jgi:xanthine dehydrogenase accessory factor
MKASVLDLLNQIISRSNRNEPLAVCTLVGTRGSTPQRPGAMMLVLANGQTLGTIGGGCVEAEVRTRALRLIFDSIDRLLTFKLDHDLGWDDGLICGGVMDVAVQVVASPEQAADFRKAHEQLASGIPTNLHIAVPNEHGPLVHFDVPIEPIPTLVIAGAGHVGAALAAIASQMDFQVTVIDDRPDFASKERFPHAVLRIGHVESELEKLALTPQTYVVIVTRGHRRDALALSAVVRSQAKYIGLIGSRRKIIKIFEDLREQGCSTEQLSRVHAPIGLNIGAVTPAEIAISIAAELIALRRGRLDQPAKPMRLTQAMIDRL